MKPRLRNRRGSLTILAVFIFMLMMTSVTLMLTFSTIQAALARNQLEKVQSRYKTEDGLNKLIYKEENVEKYIKPQLLRRYRTGWNGIHKIAIEKDDDLRSYIGSSSFSFQNIESKEVVFFEIQSNYNELVSDIIAYGPCVNSIFELNRSLLDEEVLEDTEIELFSKLIEDIEQKNWDYNFPMGDNYKKINTKNDLAINFVYENRDYNLACGKKLIQNYGRVNQISENFTDKSLIIHLKRDDIVNRSLTIGSLESNDVITMQGVLYLEGDLIINQDFVFEGLIIMNEGKIIVNSINKPTVKGMIINKGDRLDIDSLDLIHYQKAIYKAGSFLPGFLDIDIQVIKKY